jgi:hypothetical protein
MHPTSLRVPILPDAMTVMVPSPTGVAALETQKPSFASSDILLGIMTARPKIC